MGETVGLLLWEKRSVGCYRSGRLSVALGETVICFYERDSRRVAVGVCGEVWAGFLRDGLLGV